MLTPEEIHKIKDELLSCKNPLFFFHDDPDGLASFMLFYRFVKEGQGRPIKAYPQITIDYAKKVEEYGADKVFVLDIALVDQEFIDAVKVPVIWIDHHPPQDRERVQYYNPRKSKGINVPTPVLCYQITQAPEDLWIATTGAIGDWYWPEYVAQFQEQYPDLLPKSVQSIPVAMFTTRLGTLIKVFSFNLKGPTSEVHQSVKIFTRLESPYEILNQSTPRGKFLWKKYEIVNKEYEKLKSAALQVKPTDGLYVFTYTADNLSLTKDLANELLYLMPETVIILGREKSGELRCSMRSSTAFNIQEILKKALVGVEGYGGGHEQAVGLAVKKEDWERFLAQLREELKRAKK